ncbi:MAG: tRNA uridine-5-carboxymethylaminomethyl(34) synthesis enzyme MnmG, partial [Pseudomonadota bacterium]|nr:tRNA uridine-5-carboxymethylaminomethyl(34) synthesis enzyme MnmG [Pseudomonadota bacterium]
RSALDLLQYNHISFFDLCRMWPQLQSFPADIIEQMEIETIYSGYLERQKEDAMAFRKEEGMLIPESIDYDAMPSLSNEVKTKLKKTRPGTVGMASRIQGITPAAIITLMSYIKKNETKIST